MLSNLAMGFDVYDAVASVRRAGVADVVIGGAFKLSDPSTPVPDVALQPYPLATVPVSVADAKPIDDGALRR